MESIAILYICTGKYSVLWKEFYESTEMYFCKDYSKEYYVFTDALTIEYACNNERVHLLYQKPLPWPYPTLLRFSMFQSISEKLRKHDYVFFFNANAKILKTISAEMILPRRNHHEKLVVAKHPTYNWSCFDNPFDRNPRCKAYVPYGLGKLYIQACLLGGTEKNFMRMTRKLAKQIDNDLKHGVIALWHDESYVNRYILFRHDYRLLGREFVRQTIIEGQENIILMRPKNLFFDVDKVKENPPMTELSPIMKEYDRISFKIAKSIDHNVERIKNHINRHLGEKK